MNNSITKTEKLYYTNPHTDSFSARVLSCDKTLSGFEIILDRTAFFPNEGGQPSDTGYIGYAKVLNVKEENGVIIHLADSPVDKGCKTVCNIDFDKRFIYMQTHSGEHIISGLIYRNFGYKNVGFHINTDAPGCTIDCSGLLTHKQLDFIEKEANEAVYRNIPINQIFPVKEELCNYEYRCKLKLTENIRLIKIDGIDLCACCAPHVSHSGEIGLIKIISAVSHRGGTRITAVCGKQAFADYEAKHKQNLSIATLLSAKHNETSSATSKLLDSYNELKRNYYALKKAAVISDSQNTTPVGENICFITSNAPTDALRECVNQFMKRYSGICGAFSGDDDSGYSYIIGSNSCNLSFKCKEINAALRGKGGGKPEMIQGFVKADRTEIMDYFKLPL